MWFFVQDTRYLSFLFFIATKLSFFAPLCFPCISVALIIICFLAMHYQLCWAALPIELNFYSSRIIIMKFFPLGVFPVPVSSIIYFSSFVYSFLFIERGCINQIREKKNWIFSICFGSTFSEFCLFAWWNLIGTK